jgi:hypothetical protein
MVKFRELIVSIVTAICLIFLAYISSFIDVEYNFITSNAPFYLFFIYLITSDKRVVSYKNTIPWSLGIVALTLFVVLFSLI